MSKVSSMSSALIVLGPYAVFSSNAGNIQTPMISSSVFHYFCHGMTEGKG